MKMYWADAVRFYLQLRDQNPDSDLYWSSLADHSDQYKSIRDTATGNPEWDSFDATRQIAYPSLYTEVFQHFVELRAKLLDTDQKVSNMELVDIAKQGSYVAYYPEISFTDPAAEVISDFLFNGETMPPPTLWIFAGESYYEDYQINHILCWIPPEFKELAQDAIESAPDECIINATSSLYKSIAKEQLKVLGLF